jgi:hypothetical protein
VYVIALLVFGVICREPFRVVFFSNFVCVNVHFGKARKVEFIFIRPLDKKQDWQSYLLVIFVLCRWRLAALSCVRGEGTGTYKQFLHI